MTNNKTNPFRKIPPFNSIILLVFVFSINFCFGQDKIINEIKTYNDEGNYQKAVKQIKKYQEKKYDTLNCNYLISLADYYCIPKNTEYNPYKAISIVQGINCAKISAEILGIYFKDIQDCNLVLKNKNDRYVSLYFEIIYNSNDLDTLKSFYTDIKSYKEYKDKIYQKIALISFNKAKQTNSKSELLKYQKEFANTSFASEATVLIEEIDYESATSINTIESYTGFLKNYPQTNKQNKILPKLEALKWQECVTLNTKSSYQMFINEFPNSTKLQEAKMMLSKFVNVFNLDAINSFSTLSNEKQMFNPFKISNGKIIHPHLTLLQISHNGKTALAVTSFANGGNRIASDNIARLIDLTDGAIIFEFPYVGFSNYFFNSDDSKLFYYDNKFIKQIDLNSFEITNLFEIESKAYNFQYMCFEKNTIHFCQDQYESHRKKFLHYTYDLSTAKKDLEVFYEFDYSVRDIQKELSAFSGTTEEKLLKLKLIYGDEIIIKPLTKNSTNEFLIFMFPTIMVIKNGVFTYSNNITIKKTDRVTNEIKNEYFELNRNGWFNEEIQLTENNEIVFTSQDALYVLPLGNNDGTFPNNEIRINQIDPFKIDINSNSGFLFAELDCKTGKLYYQIDRESSEQDYIVFVHDYNSAYNLNKAPMKLKIDNKLKEIDKELNKYYSSYINAETIKNQPLESDIEKYQRVKIINDKINYSFIKMQDSLFYILNKTIKDSIKSVKYNANKIFFTSNYSVDGEYWRLVFENPFRGKDFSIIYHQPKSEAKENLANNFANILVEVKYCFNLLSMEYEPLFVNISNVKSNEIKKIFNSYKDGALLKNLFLTDNSYSDNLHWERGGVVGNQLWNGYISYDQNILRYFVNNGKPKYYFNYGFVEPAQSNTQGVSIRNLDNSNLNFNFQNKFENCCPSEDPIILKYVNGFSQGGILQYLRFDDISYFINKSGGEKGDKKKGGEEATSIYELNKTAPLDIMDGIRYKGQSFLPNGWVIKHNILKGNSEITAATLEIIDSKLSTAVKTFNLVELGGYSGRFESVDYNASISPNGKLFAVRCNTKTYLYETSNWTNVMNFDNTSGRLYWDCNSYYLGVGNDLIPVLLLDF